MIMQYLGVDHAADDGHVLNQADMDGADHMQTDINLETSFESDLFRIGLNKWWQGQSMGFYSTKDSPTNSEFRASLSTDIDWGVPFGVSTLEGPTNKWDHYNQHPYTNLWSGHWIVAQGYLDSQDTTSFDDPAGNAPRLDADWDNVSPDFRHSTNDFNQTWVQSHGIVW